MTAPCRIVSLAAALAAAACSPTLNWREVRPAGVDAVALFPCKPQTHERHIRLADADARWTLLECRADELTWALGYADLGDPARVTPALQALRRAAGNNLDAGVRRDMAAKIEGETPNVASGAVRLEGRLPDGRAAVAQVSVFSRGTLVFQATVLGSRLPNEAVRTFFSGLRLHS